MLYQLLHDNFLGQKLCKIKFHSYFKIFLPSKVLNKKATCLLIKNKLHCRGSLEETVSPAKMKYRTETKRCSGYKTACCGETPLLVLLRSVEYPFYTIISMYILIQNSCKSRIYGSNRFNCKLFHLVSVWLLWKIGYQTHQLLFTAKAILVEEQ